jgi:hypothetical protein
MEKKKQTNVDDILSLMIFTRIYTTLALRHTRQRGLDPVVYVITSR